MLFRTLAAVSALLAATPALAQEGASDRADIVAGARQFIKPTNAERTQVLVGFLTTLGLTPEIQVFQGGNNATGPMEGANVVVTVGQGDKDIVLTAHYDAVKLRDGTLSQGIVDNVGSVMAMMEAAKTLDMALEGQPVAHRFVFVFTDQEELGLLGAKAFLEKHGKDRIAAVINADVAAYGQTIMYGENNGEQSRFVLETLRTLCAERNFDCMPYPTYPPSDDRAFSAAGVPVVSMGTQDAVGAHQMWLAFNGGENSGLKEGFVPPVFQRIHSTDDKLSYLKGADVARFGLFIADLGLALDKRLVENQAKADAVAAETAPAPGGED
ncbi:succinyl-diaminopimelate desuccinylase [Brevundimonas sp. SH203]|uniref:M28 family metallopeptidase n=1 Tax=Brevundimonas sp. SH203 TaxID=345167 RepID=UPI0009C4F7BF|nr:M20/M25/M40 family metallo-hydrolase [Brevundimonas sp. SH203]GAW41884.1 succinyl-diaminopimelate desuccinylase [Brevundimonas sp. SH203]